MLSNYSKFNVLNLIKGRRNTKQFSDEDISIEEIEILLEAAVWAPNHRNIEPWRFFVIRKDSPIKSDIANGLIDLQEKASGITSSDIQKQRIIGEVSDYPSLIFVYSLVDDSDEMTEENYGAVCCAIQNMQLVATSIGLSAGWSTGKVDKLHNMDAVLGITEKLKMVGVLTIGEPEDSVDKGRTSYEELTQWF